MATTGVGVALHGHDRRGHGTRRCARVEQERVEQLRRQENERASGIGNGKKGWSDGLWRFEVVAIGPPSRGVPAGRFEVEAT
jgi:hypothetical protein